MQSIFVYDMEPIARCALVRNSEEWKEAAYVMPTLCTYILIKDFTCISVMVRANLHRKQRSVLSKFLCGILPIEIETGRFHNIKRELRFCKMCLGKTVIEDDMHFLHKCTRLDEARSEYIPPLKAGFEGDATKDIISFTRYLLQEDNIKDFAKALESMYMYRKDLLYKLS